MAKTATKAKADARLLERAEKRVSTNPSMQFTPEALARLTALEAEAQAEANNDPDLKLQFATVTDFLQQWAMLNPEEQAQLGQKFTEQANSMVDIPFDQQQTDLKTSFNQQMKALNTKYKFMTDAEMLKMGQNVENMDRNTVEQLTAAFNDIEARGLGNSGAMKKIADAIVGDNQNALEAAQAASRLTREQGKEALQQGTEVAQTGFDQASRGIEQERTVARIEKKDELVNDALQRDLLGQIIAGGTDLAPRTYTPAALNPDALPTPDATASAGTAIPPAKRIRDIRLGIAGETPPAPVEPAMPKTTSTAGMTVDQRRQIRLNRLNS